MKPLRELHRAAVNRKCQQFKDRLRRCRLGYSDLVRDTGLTHAFLSARLGGRRRMEPEVEAAIERVLAHYERILTATGLSAFASVAGSAPHMSDTPESFDNDKFGHDAREGQELRHNMRGAL